MTVKVLSRAVCIQTLGISFDIVGCSRRAMRLDPVDAFCDEEYPLHITSKRELERIGSSEQRCKCSLEKTVAISLDAASLTFDQRCAEPCRMLDLSIYIEAIILDVAMMRERAADSKTHLRSHQRPGHHISHIAARQRTRLNTMKSPEGGGNAHSCV